MSEIKRQLCGRPVYSTTVPAASDVATPLQFEQVEHCEHPVGPQLHEIRVIDESYNSAPSQVRYEWLKQYAATVHPEDWIFVRIGTDDEYEYGLSTIVPVTHPDGHLSVKVLAEFEEVVELQEPEFEWVDCWFYKKLPTQRVGDFQSLIECFERCHEEYWANFRFNFESDSGGGCQFLERFFAKKSPHAARLLYVVDAWRCVIYGDGIIDGLYLGMRKGTEVLELHLGDELNEYSEDEWTQLHQMLYQKHWTVTASLNEWQMSIGCPLNMSVAQRIARITDLAARTGVELGDAVAITYTQVSAFLPFKEIHDLYLRYVIAFAPTPLDAHLIKKIFLLVSEYNLAMPDYIATRLIENVRRVYQYRAALFEQFESGVSQNAWRVQPTRSAKRKALLGIEIDRNECKLLEKDSPKKRVLTVAQKK